MRKLVIIPTYNEKENISAMIDKVFSLPEPFELLVIDDGSPDGKSSPKRFICWSAAANRGWERPI